MSNEVQVYEVWEYDGRYYGHKIDHKPYWLVLRDYPYRYDLAGQEAHFLIVTNDGGMTRQGAINFAQAIHVGKYQKIHIDLEKMEVTKS